MITEDDLAVVPEVPEVPVREPEQVGEALPLYLQEIGRVKLLTGPDEVELAMAIEAGNLARDQLRADDEMRRAQIGRALHLEDYRPCLTPEQLEELNDTIEVGERARRRLIESNLRLVVSVARRYMNRGLPLSDLIQEGNIGLLRAVEKFDYRRGFKFSTDATWWIRQAVTRAISDH